MLQSIIITLKEHNRLNFWEIPKRILGKILIIFSQMADLKLLWNVVIKTLSILHSEPTRHWKFTHNFAQTADNSSI